jgi:hypothetical protein
MVYHGLAVKHLGKAVLITIFQTFTDWRRGASIETRSWLHTNSTFGHHHFSTISPSGLIQSDDDRIAPNCDHPTKFIISHFMPSSPHPNLLRNQA